MLPDSPAIDTGSLSLVFPDRFDLDTDGNTSEALPTDQRGAGFARVGGTATDLGAYEAGSGSGGTGGTAIAEVGTLTLTSNRQIVNFLNTYVNPVVIVNPLSLNGSAAAIARLDNITGSSFDVFIQEPDSDDGVHAAEVASYLVVEAGTWELGDGTILSADTLDTSGQVTTSGFESADFLTRFESTPAVFSQVQTFNGSSFVRTRQQGLTRNGFQVGMEEEEANLNTGHATEAIGYVALDRGAGTWDGNPFLVSGTG